MNRLIGYFVVAASFCLFPSVTPVWTRLENEVTVYMLSCDGEQVDGVCKGKEKADMPLTYKVSVDQHSVLFWRMDDPGLLHRLPFCAIHDTKSWLCQWNSDEAPKTRFGMEGGNYVEIATCMTDTPRSIFYQVPMWRWWLVWLHGKLFPTALPSMDVAGFPGGQSARRSSGH